MFQSITKFISYWYFRYLLVTELYMVEKWERVVMQSLFIVVFTLLTCFNVAVVLPSTQYFTKGLFEDNFDATPQMMINPAVHSNILGDL